MITECIIFGFLLIIGLAVSVCDSLTGEIQNKLILMLLVVGLVSYFSHIRSGIWWLPLATSIGLFVLFFLVYLVTEESLIGGGDIKLICVSMLFLYDFELVLYYLIWSSLFLLIGASLALYRKERSVRCGPYYSLALVVTIFPMDNYGMLIAIVFLMVLTILLFKNRNKGELINVYKINK